MPVSIKPVEFATPPLGSVLSYKVIYALCTVDKVSGMLKATHYTSCLVAGPSPMWGVWTIHGVFQRFFGRKSAIAEAYPRLTWRRKHGTWALTNVHDKEFDERVADLKKQYHKGAVLEATLRVVVDPPMGSNIVRLKTK